jgi:hypothetical protein
MNFQTILRLRSKDLLSVGGPHDQIGCDVQVDAGGFKVAQTISRELNKNRERGSVSAQRQSSYAMRLLG